MLRIDYSPIEITCQEENAKSKNPKSFTEFLDERFFKSRKVFPIVEKYKSNSWLLRRHIEWSCPAGICHRIKKYITNPSCCLAPECVNDKHHRYFKPRMSWWCPICRRHSTDPEECYDVCEYEALWKILKQHIVIDDLVLIILDEGKKIPVSFFQNGRRLSS